MYGENRILQTLHCGHFLAIRHEESSQPILATAVADIAPKALVYRAIEK